MSHGSSGLQATPATSLVVSTALATPSLLAAATLNRVVSAAASHPVAAAAVATTSYLGQYWLRKRIAAAIFLIHRYRFGPSPGRSELAESTAAPGSPSPARPASEPAPPESVDFMDDEWSPRVRTVTSLLQLMPDEIAQYAERVGIDAQQDVDLVEGLLSDVLDPDRWPDDEECVLVRTLHGLQFCDLRTLECQLLPHNALRAEALDGLRCEAAHRASERNGAGDNRDDAMASFGGPALRASINEDRIFQRFLDAAAEESRAPSAQSLPRTSKSRGPSVSFARDASPPAAAPGAGGGWMDSMRGAVSSLRDIVAVSARPNVVGEAQAVAKSLTPTDSGVSAEPAPPVVPVPTKRPPPPPPPPANSAVKHARPPPGPPPPPPPPKKTAPVPTRKAPPPPPPSSRPEPTPVDGREAMLAEIRGGAAKLRHVERDERPGSARRPQPKPSTVVEELQRRFRKPTPQSEESW